MFIAAKYDPMRDPAWRSERVRYLVESGSKPKQPTQFDDTYIRTYRRWLMGWRKGKIRTRERLIAECPGLYYAHKFAAHPDREWKAILDSKILARLDDDLIAAELDTLPDAIHWYEALFFNVRDRLHASTYIVKMVLGPPARRSLDYDDVLTEDMRYMCYRLFAYYGGPMVLDTLLAAISNLGPWPRRTDDLATWMDQAFKMEVRKRSNITAGTFTVNRFNAMELMQIHTALIGQAEAARNAGAGSVANEYTRNLEMFMEQMPIGIGQSAADARSPELLNYEQSAVEPRAHEMVALSQGDVPETLKFKVATAPPFETGDDDDGK